MKSRGGEVLRIDLPPDPAPILRPAIIPVFLPHAGCPHRCVFCDQRTITGESDHALQPDLEALAARWREARSGSPRRLELAFYGGNFLGLPPERVRSLLAGAEALVRRGRIATVRFSTRPDSIDDRRLQSIAGSPVSTVELGGQSMDDEVLRAAGRGHTSRDTALAVHRLRRAGLRVGIQTMIGLPGQDMRSALVSAGRFAALKPDFVRIYPCLVLAGSPLAAAYRQGRFRPLALDEAVETCVRLRRIFARHAIPVIRTGLQASADLADASRVLAGPYHPAFGHLVFSALYYRAIVRGLRRLPAPAGRRLHVVVHPRHVSRVRGLGNANVRALMERFALAGVRVASDPGLDLRRPAMMLELRG